jgi:hypothetical protein
MERKPGSEIVAMPSEKPDNRTVTPRHDAEAAVLDLMQPTRPAWRAFGWRRQTGLDEADRAASMQT